ncbi:hypothetical protein [Deinococcus alpinitundrae]|uniref:hypothetical protein n=1 Tax=Deinococcus alpinitundrae TaxID=468913 RepID=UPI00137A1585|nr:hypothetical protein [Deinococcus alpinitundrae]
MSLWNKASLIGLPLVVAGCLGTMAQRLNPQPLQIDLPLELDCIEPPKFEVGYEGGENYLVMRNKTYHFQSTSWLQVDLCSAGILEISGYGEEAGDEAPRLAAILNSQVLDIQSFTQEHTWKLRIPAPGRLILGYFNDYYLADVRVATLSHFEVKSSQCIGVPRINVTRASSSKWYESANVATIISSSILTAVPCGPGQLTFSLVGREGNNAFPQLSIMQGGKVLAQPLSRAQSQTVSLEVGASPVKIILLNPYGKTLADRNLIITRLKFSPR